MGVPSAIWAGAQNVAFAGAVLALSIVLADRPWRRTAARAATPEVFVLGVALFTAWMLPRWQATILVVLGALVEELVFRRRLPALLTDQLRCDDWVSRGSAVTLAQLAFGVSHFVASHVDPFGEGLPLIRLFAAGMIFAVIYAWGGLLPAVVLHAFLNEGVRTGRYGMFDPPESAIVLAIALVATGAVFARERLTGRDTARERRPPSVDRARDPAGRSERVG